MDVKYKDSPKEELLIHINSSGTKDIKQILKEILLEKARHISTSQSIDVK